MKYLLSLVFFVCIFNKSNAQAPVWSVTPSDFQFTANVTGQLTLNNTLLNTDGNQLAAFVGDSLRGVSNSIIVNGQRLFFLTVYSNLSTGETIHFKAYIVAEDSVYNVIDSLPFESGVVYGNPTAPQLLRLNATIIPPSLNVIPGQIGLTNSNFSPIALNSYLVNLSNVPIAYQLTNISPNLNPIINNDTLFVSSGSIPGTDSLEVKLVDAINQTIIYDRKYITFKSHLVNTPISFTNFGNILAGNNSPSCTNLSQYLNNTDGDSLIWQLVSPEADSIGTATTTWTINPPDYTYNMSLTAQLVLNGNIATGIQITLGAFINNTLAGKCTLQNVLGKWIGFMTVYSNTINDTVSFQLFDTTRHVLYENKLGDQSFIVDGIIGSFNNPYSIYFGDYNYTFNQGLLCISPFDSSVVFSAPFTVIATEALTGELYTDSVSFTYTSFNENQPLYTTIPNQTISISQTFTTFDLDNYLIELDSDTVLYSIQNTNNVSITIDANHIVNISPINPLWTGSDTVRFVVTDSTVNQLSGYQDVIYAITPIIPADTIILVGIPDQTIYSNQTFTKTNLLNHLAYSYPDSVIWTVSSNQLITSIQSDSLVAVFPSANWVGIDTIIVRATQINSLTNYDVDTVIYTSNALPDTIILAGVPDQTIYNNQTFTKTNLLNYLAYLYPDSVIWTVSSNQLITSIQSDTLVAMFPSANWLGIDTIIVRATQINSLTNYDVDTVIYKRIELNSQPVITISEYTVLENALLQTEIGQINFIDSNLTQSHIITLLTPNLPFILNSITGKIYVNETLDYETKSSYLAQVVVRDNGNTILRDTALITILVLDVAEGDDLPSGDFVSPNDDGKNDFWLIENVGQFRKFNLSIFDANGQSVYTISENYNNDWDAKLKGVALPNGNYYYLLKEPETSKTYKGVITIYK
jgi:gliding motility-associated-like protein